MSPQPVAGAVAVYLPLRISDDKKKDLFSENKSVSLFAIPLFSASGRLLKNCCSLANALVRVERRGAAAPSSHQSMPLYHTEILN